MIEQAIILCGGMGTRLGALSASTPKPLLTVGGTPFLQILMQEIARCGVRKFLLLGGHLSEQIEAFAQTVGQHLRCEVDVKVLVEPYAAGTGGALFHAKDHAMDTFLLVNGDSLFDFQPRKLSQLLASHFDAIGAIGLRRVDDCARFGSVVLANDRITHFEEKGLRNGPGLINGGVYLFRRDILDTLSPKCSLELDVLPSLSARGQLLGYAFDEGYFIDIGLPTSYDEAKQYLQHYRQRPAVFLDRDGVLNKDVGHIGTKDRFIWQDRAVDAIRLLNDAGYFVFVVTNQAGIAKGKYSLDDYWCLRDHIRSEVFEGDAQIDDERFCPYHPDGHLSEWRRDSDWRKPAPGMLTDLLDSWPVKRDASFLIGDQPTDLAAASAAGIDGYRFDGGNLFEFVRNTLRERAMNGLTS